MSHVASQIRTMVAREEDSAARAAEGSLPGKEAKRFHHMMMSGPPGTGKTTVADDLAGVLYDLGVIKEHKMYPTHASDLVGQYTGEAQANMLEALKKAKGGVLFIDEAHQLAKDQFGQRALQTLIKPMADPDFDTVVIFAGYPDQLKELYKVDEGLRSRIPTDLKFKRFNQEELKDFAMIELDKDRRNLKISGQAEDALDDAMEVIASNPNHASMRDVNNLLNDANDARINRNKANKKKPIKNRTALTASDIGHALSIYQEQQETG
jgi:replication-associated recombination protein RarA